MKRLLVGPLEKLTKKYKRKDTHPSTIQMLVYKMESLSQPKDLNKIGRKVSKLPFLKPSFKNYPLKMKLKL